MSSDDGGQPTDRAHRRFSIVYRTAAGLLGLGAILAGCAVLPAQRNAGITMIPLGASVAQEISWSPDGRNLAFQRAYSRLNAQGDRILRNTVEVWSVHSPRRVWSAQTPGDQILPSWLPDGTNLCYVSPSHGMRVADIATKSVQSIGMPASGSPDAGESYLLDSNHLLYTHSGRGQSEIRASSLDGTTDKLWLARPNASLLSSSESPSGEWVAVIERRAQEDRLAVVSAGVNHRTAVDLAAYGEIIETGWIDNDTALCLSARGSGGRLVAVSLPSGRATTLLSVNRPLSGMSFNRSRGLIAISCADEGGRPRLVLLTRPGRIAACSPSGKACGAPSWSPDGRRFAFTVQLNDGTGNGIAIMDTDELLRIWRRHAPDAKILTVFASVPRRAIMA